VYDVVSIRKHHPSAFEWVKKEVERAIQECSDDDALPARSLRIPVCYDSAFGVDLKTLARTSKLLVNEVIALHTQQTYRVYMLGFLPGFPYMGIVDDKIATPRLSTPRKHVPAGSVGIAGNQTGIYPVDSPGGWNIIGRTPVKLFDPESESLALLQPGDEVSFIPISKSAYESFDAENFQLVQP
jgi:inhibitor of KinA